MKSLEEYLALPYTKIIKRDEDGDFVASVAELPGCVVDSSTETAAIEALNEAQQMWIASAMRGGREVPVPSDTDDSLPSGKWLQRVPRSLHQKLVVIARSEGVSLNQFATSVLAEAVGGKAAVKAPDETSPWLLHRHGDVDAGWVIAKDAELISGRYQARVLKNLQESLPEQSRWQMETEHAHTTKH